MWLRRAAACSPHDRQITYRLYQCLQQLGQEDEAARTAARLQEIDADLLRMRELVQEVMRRPRDAGLRYEAGMIFLKNGLTEEGLAWLAMALENDPQHRPTHQALAEHYEQAGQPARAAAHREALRKLGGGQEGPPAKTP